MKVRYPLWRCLAMYRYMPGKFLLTAALFLIANLSLAWQQWLVGKAIMQVQSGNTSWTFNLTNFDEGGILPWLFLLLCVAVSRGVLQYLAGVMALFIGQELLYILREKIFHQVQKLDLAYHWQHGMGEIITRTTRDADKVRDALINFWRQLFEATLIIIAAVGLLSWYHPALGIVPLILTMIGITVFIRQTENLVILDRAVGAAYDRVNQELSEGVNGIRIIKSFAIEQQRSDNFSLHINHFMRQAKSALFYASTRVPLPQVIVSLSHLWILAFGAYLIQEESLQPGELVASVLIATTLVFRFEGIGRIMQIFADARSSAARIWEFLDENPVIESGTKKIPDGEIGLKFQAVCVRFPGSNNLILNDCSFTISPGEVVALVGATGSGKSTIVGLIPRLLQIDKGVIELGSDVLGWQDIHELDLFQLRKKVQAVPQESFLFSDTLEVNLKLANPKLSEKDILNALETTSSGEILKTLEYGLKTRLGERGVTLSGGQRQRLCLARALLSHPAFLVLDDATSALDAVTERNVLRNIRQWKQIQGHRVTVLMIASKLSTVLQADKVLLLSQGRILAQGTHEFLSQTCPEYRQLIGVDL
ncbi:MAG: ABC transporter ATP-binding protein [Burkholderiales bacterium]|nr:ABC transporter ATP-binding protein [Microcystis sp. M020S1]MCA3176555.1 ABC transporter ATP-binding protein [Burkholderiales bacterium]